MQDSKHYETYRAVKCPCGDPICQAWHVAPVADVQGVNFTKDQATYVAAFLNGMEKGASK